MQLGGASPYAATMVEEAQFAGASVAESRLGNHGNANHDGYSVSNMCGHDVPIAAAAEELQLSAGQEVAHLAVLAGPLAVEGLAYVVLGLVNVTFVGV